MADTIRSRVKPLYANAVNPCMDYNYTLETHYHKRANRIVAYYAVLGHFLPQ